MKIANCAIQKIKPYLKNNRLHSERQIELIANSIKEFGFNQPIVIDEKNEILVGHGRLYAAQKLKLKEVPVLQVSGLSAKNKRAYRILDNKLQGDSTWDFENLSIELKILKDDGFDLGIWDLATLNDLTQEKIEAEVVLDEEDGPGSLPAKPYIKLGDKIELGKHILYCGDSSSGEIDFVIDLIITDPPYGVSYQGKTKEALEIENDNLNEAQLSKLWNSCLDNLWPKLKEGGVIYVSVPAGPIRHIFVNPLLDRKALRQELVWFKDSIVMGRSDYHYQHEPILYGWKPGSAHFITGRRDKTSVLSFPRPKKSTEHPTMKPLSLWGELIVNSSKPQQIVFDPFMGSGTTLIACESLDRICRGFEIDPRYCQVIIDRYKSHCEKSSKECIIKINGKTRA